MQKRLKAIPFQMPTESSFAVNRTVVSQTNNETTVDQVENLDKYIVELENLHKLKADQGLTPKEVARLRQSNQQAIRVILALEIAKKRGDK